MPCDLMVYSDRANGTTNDGVGLADFRGEEVVRLCHRATCPWSSSFEAKGAAFSDVISWLADRDDWEKAAVICDCKFLVDALANVTTTDKKAKAYRHCSKAPKMSRDPQGSGPLQPARQRTRRRPSQS